MKLWFFVLATTLALSGCATRKEVATMEGHGKRQTYAASYEQVWRAAVDATQIGDLRIDHADKTQGYIAAHRGVQPMTFGENVGVWVRPLSPAETQVEVVSRQAGPPELWIKNWEDDVLNSISANLTKEANNLPRVIHAPAGAEPAPVPPEPDPQTIPPPPPPPTPPESAPALPAPPSPPFQ